jgi:hypothetical protein
MLRVSPFLCNLLVPPKTMQPSPLQEVREDIVLDNVDDNHGNHHQQQQQKRRPHSCSHVSLDYFDPRGVQRLQEHLRRISTTGVPGVRDSSVTLTDHFDFEQTLRSIFEQFVPFHQLLELLMSFIF